MQSWFLSLRKGCLPCGNCLVMVPQDRVQPCEEGIEVKVNFICCHWAWTVLGGSSILQTSHTVWISVESRYNWWGFEFPRFPLGKSVWQRPPHWRKTAQGSGWWNSWWFNMKDLRGICCRLCSITRFLNGLNHQLQHHLIMEFNPAPSVPKSFTLRQWKKVVTVTSHWIITIPI